MTDFIYLDIDPNAGTVTPVWPEQVHAETEGYNVPPVPMPRPLRRRWQSLMKKYRKTMSPAKAWYRASVKVL